MLPPKKRARFVTGPSQLLVQEIPIALEPLLNILAIPLEPVGLGLDGIQALLDSSVVALREKKKS